MTCVAPSSIAAAHDFCIVSQTRQTMFGRPCLCQSSCGLKWIASPCTSRSIGASAEPAEEVTVEVIASTSETAYAESNIDAILNEGKTQYEGEQDLAGPVGLAAVATMSIDTTAALGSPMRSAKSRVVVFGDSDFASNSYLDLGGNRDLVLNTISWLADEEDLIAIRPKNSLSQPVMLTARQGRIVFWLPVIFIPFATGAIGVAVAVRKRRSP